MDNALGYGYVKAIKRNRTHHLECCLLVGYRKVPVFFALAFWIGYSGLGEVAAGMSL